MRILLSDNQHNFWLFDVEKPENITDIAFAVEIANSYVQTMKPDPYLFIEYGQPIKLPAVDFTVRVDWETETVEVV